MPCGYTISADTNNPTVIPIAVWIIPNPKLVRELPELPPEVFAVPFFTESEYSIADRIDPDEAIPDGTSVKIPGIVELTAFPCQTRLYRFARRPIVNAPTVFATSDEEPSLCVLK